MKFSLYLRLLFLFFQVNDAWTSCWRRKGEDWTDFHPPTTLLNGMWRAPTTIAEPVLPDPTDWGWIFDREGKMKPQWTTLPAAAVSCKELVCCDCKNNCGKRYKCVKADLLCTPLCMCDGQCIRDYSWSTSRVNGNLNTWFESSNEQATFSDVTEITKEILKISLKFAKMDLEKQGVVTGQIFVLSRDRVIFWVRFLSVVQKRFRRRRRWNYVNYFADAGFLFQPNDRKREQTLELNACVRTVAPNEVDGNQDTCAVSSNYWWQFFLVARLIKDKADASSTVNQSVIWELFVWSWNSIQNINRQKFRAKYLKSETEFEDHYLLCVCCVFGAFPSFWRPFGAILCLTVDATSHQSQATSTWQDVPSTVKQYRPKRPPEVRKSG